MTDGQHQLDTRAIELAVEAKTMSMENSRAIQEHHAACAKRWWTITLGLAGIVAFLLIVVFRDQLSSAPIPIPSAEFGPH